MNLESLIVFILLLGVLVAFHELGHFIAAKASGIKVEEFALGFGPRLIRLCKRSETEYTIHLIPLGGFVKLAGGEPGEENVPDGFQSKPVLKRALVIFAGPLFSFILAVLAFEMIGVFWGFQDGTKTLNKVLMVDAQTVASGIDMRAGDEIQTINGTRIKDGLQMVDIIHALPGKPVTLVIKRNGRVFRSTATPRWAVEYLGADWSFMKREDKASVYRIADDSEAAKAGVREDDLLESINGTPITSGKEMSDLVRANGTKPVVLRLTRGNQQITARVTPSIQWVDYAGARWYFPDKRIGRMVGPHDHLKILDEIVSIGGKKISTGEQMLAAINGTGTQQIEVARGDESKRTRLTVSAGHVDSAVSTAEGRLGFTPQFAFTKVGFWQAIAAGWHETGDLISLIFQSLAPGKIGKSVGGPVMIARQTSITVELGPYYVLKMGAMLSLSLAIINLFPIPVFDGGHLALLGLEAIRRRKLTRDQMQWVQMVGLAIIGVLVLTIFFSDITKIIGGQVPQ